MNFSSWSQRDVAGEEVNDVVEREVREISRERIQGVTAGSEMQGPHARTGEKPPEAKNGRQLTACKEASQSYNHKELDSVNNVYDLRSKFFPQPLDKSPVSQHLDPSLVRPAAEEPTKAIWTSDPKKHEIINLYCFRSLSLC